MIKLNQLRLLAHSTKSTRASGLSGSTRSINAILNRRTFSTTSQSADPLKSHCTTAINEMKDAGTFKEERVITGKQGPSVQVQSGSSSTTVLNFCANNYLGLCDNQDLIDAAKSTLDNYGYGMSSVRFICGTQTIHKQLEQRLSNYHSMEDTILFPSGFDANAGFFEAILGPDDAIISDSLNHASIIDGIRLCKSKYKYRYDHLSMESLEEKIIDAKSKVDKDRLIVIVTDGVFSMDGDVAPLDRIRELCDKYGPNCYLYVDECHATGFMGRTGRGTMELFGGSNSSDSDSSVKIDFLSTTLGKSMGGATGGYLSSNKEVISVLRNKARTYLFTNTIAPVVAGTSLKVLDMLENESYIKPLQDQLKSNTSFVRKEFKANGLNVLGHDQCPIVPVYIGDATKAQMLSKELLNRGIYAIAFSFPVVAKGMARIRFQLSAAHTQEHIEKLVRETVGASKEIGVL